MVSPPQPTNEYTARGKNSFMSRVSGITAFPAMVFTAIALFTSLSAVGASPSPCTFIQLCDTQLGMGGYEEDKARFRAAVKTINGLDVDWVVICGDLVDNGGDEKAIADFREIVEGFTAPCYLAPGNHDVGGVPTEATLARYRKHHGKDYFAVENSGFKIMILNTQFWKGPMAGESERHEAWYLEELAEAKTSETPVLLVSHYPPFLKSVDEEEIYYNLPLKARTRVLKAAKDGGVQAWLAGHAHKNVITDHEGIQIVVSATTSRNFDGAPYGYRVWTVDASGALTHEYKALDLSEALQKPKEKPKKK